MCGHHIYPTEVQIRPYNYIHMWKYGEYYYSTCMLGQLAK